MLDCTKKCAKNKFKICVLVTKCKQNSTVQNMT